MTPGVWSSHKDQTHDRMFYLSQHGNFEARLHKVNCLIVQEVHTYVNIGTWSIKSLFFYLESVR